ncbi:MAG: type II toxin-antitoxin system VapC family toxin [Leptospiraceae bacterium]|nr:type II toxin-antitoxin system VapC family toxin [Leptospiraceae bacterium]
MKQYLLDTNICIYILNQRPESVYRKFKKVKIENISISAITEFELNYGIQKSANSEKNKSALAEFLSYLKKIAFSTKTADIAARIRVQLEKQGKPIGPYDLLIASEAFSQDLILVTNNEKEFKRIKGLKIENWV